MAIPGGPGATGAAPPVGGPAPAPPTMNQFTGNPQTFVNLMAPYAAAAQAATGINAEVILAQWGNETAWGTSHAFKSNFNPAGIGITGSGVAGKNYGSIEAGVQAYIAFVNGNSRYQIVKNAGVNNPQAQAVAFGNSGWAAGKYDNGGGPGSSLLADMSSFTAPSGVTPAGLGIGANTPAQNAALSSAVAEGGGAYLTALNQAAQPQGANPASGASATAPAPGDQSKNGDAYSQISTALNQYGLGSLAGWAWSELTNGKNSDQIMLDLQNQPAYENSVFGQANAARTKNGLAPMTPADILTYQDTASSLAQQAGLPQGSVGQSEIVTLLGHDVSATELSDRVTKGYVAANNSPQETKTLLNQYFGVDTGNLAAYYLDPTRAEGTLENQLVAAEVGTQAQESGFGALSAADAASLSQILQSQGKIGPTTGKWDVDAASQFAQIAPLQPLTEALPGQPGSASVTTEDLLKDAFTGTVKPNLLQAQQARGVALHGGGGGEVNNKGASGAGYASDEGVQGT